MGYVYLLHFSKPISDSHTSRHYLGWTNDLQHRLQLHRTGHGSRLCEVASERGITFILARTWRGDKRLERQLKKRHNAPKLCPICQNTQ